MKKLIAIALTLVSVNAFADVEQCTQTLQNMASIVTDYATAMTTCKQNAAGSLPYQQAQQISRESEALYPQLLDQCLQVCGGDANSLLFCTGTLTDACP